MYFASIVSSYSQDRYQPKILRSSPYYF